MVTLEGEVIDVERGTYHRKSDGEEVPVCDVWVTSGRKVYRTTGDEGVFEKGDDFRYRVEPRSFRNTDEVSFRRIEQVA